MSDIPPPAQQIGQGASSSSGGGKLAARDENPRSDGPPGPVTRIALCGACKFLRKRCVNGCIFAPYFGSDQGSAQFAAVHKIFGASNVYKLLLDIPENHRNEAVISICYEAQARLKDPVYGCVSEIINLQQQVAALKADISMAQAQLVNNRYAMASVINDNFSMQQSQLAAMTPAYSNAPSASNSLMNCSTSNFDLVPDGGTTAALPYTPFYPVNLTGAPRQDVED